MRARCLLAVTLLCAATGAGCGDLDTADQVHDLRLLAIKATPPEQVLPAGSPRPGQKLLPVTVTALLADPAGGGREVSYRFSTCVAVDSDTHQCTDQSAAYQVLAEGNVTPTSLGAEPSVTFTPSSAVVTQLVQGDALHGFGGVQLPVQLEITAGDESVVGIKRLTFTFAQGTLPPPNHNPELQAVRYNDATWAPDQRPTFLPTERAPRIPVGGTPQQPGTNKVTPVVDPAQFEEYDRPTFDGGSVHFQEAWRYNFFATQGTFGPASSGGSTPATGDADSTASRWTTLTGQARQAGGPMTVWIVVRDGRGGESWLSREAIAPLR